MFHREASSAPQPVLRDRSSDQGDSSALIEDALARAVIYRALSIGFQMPTEERLHQMGAHEHFGTIADALGRLDQQSTECKPDTSGPCSWTLTSAGARLTAFDVADVETLASAFVRLFGHTTRGLVCACETEYGADNTFHQPQQLADISGYYLAFGLRASPGADVRADHVACECEFMDFVNRKDALFLATGSGDGETLEATRSAARTFLRDHLGRFGRAFATRLISEDPDGFFGLLGRMLLELLDNECRRLNIQSGAIDLVVRPEVPDEAPMACGAGSQPELIQIQRRP